MRSEGKNANVAIAGGESSNINWVASCDDGYRVLGCGRDDERIDRVRRGQLQSREQMPSVLSNSARQLGDENRAGIEQMVSRGVVAWSPA